MALPDLHGEDSVRAVDLQPDWENAPTVADLETDFTEAQSDHNNMVNKIRAWLDNMNLTGPAKFEPAKGRSGVQPKVIRKQAEWRYSSLSDPFLSTSDLFDVHPISHEDLARAEQNSTILNHQWNTVINKQKFVDDMVHTDVDEGTVIVRCGWVLEETDKQETVQLFDYIPDLTEVTMTMMAQATQLKQTAPDSFRQLPAEIQAAQGMFEETGLPHIAVPAGKQIETVTKIVRNHPTVEVVKYTNIVIDPTCNGDLDNAMFIIYTFESSLTELKALNKYDNLEAITNKDEEQSEVEVSDDEFTSFRFADKPRAKFAVKEYWGYWDIHGTGEVVPIVATYAGTTMIGLEESPYPDGKLPFTAAQYLPRRRQTHGEPDGELLTENQAIIGAVQRGMIDIMAKSANGQVGHRQDALDATNRIKFRNGSDYEFNATITNPGDAFYMHKYPEIPQSAPLMITMQNQDAESLTGVKAFTSGITGNALGDTVGGQRNVLDATAKREVSILRRLAACVISIGKKLMAMNNVWLSEEEVTRITNKPFVPAREEEYGQQFDLRITISTADEDDAKASELSFMLQTMGNTVSFDITKLILIRIAKLRKMPDLAQALEEYEPKPDPLAIALQETELQNAQLEGMKIQAEIAKIQSETVLTGSKAIHEDAKTLETESLTDKVDLDFIEQESGTTQERELELARANKTESAGTPTKAAGPKKTKKTTTDKKKK